MTTSTAVVRRASTQDASALLDLAPNFIANSPYWGMVQPDAEMVRMAILNSLGGAAGTAHRGVVFVLDDGGQIVGAMVGAVESLKWSRGLVAEEVGGWVDEKHANRVDDLRDALRKWADSNRAPSIIGKAAIAAEV
jgi:hypothetical protein